MKQHCWHETGEMLTSNPPYYVEICCHCGAKRDKTYFGSRSGQHGEYAPMANSSDEPTYFYHGAVGECIEREAPND